VLVDGHIAAALGLVDEPPPTSAAAAVRTLREQGFQVLVRSVIAAPPRRAHAHDAGDRLRR